MAVCYSWGLWMLDRALFELWGDTEPGDVEKTLLPLSDENLLIECRRAAEAKREEATSSERKKKAQIAENILKALERRELFTNLCTNSFDDFPDDIRMQIQNTYGESPNGGANLAPENRTNLLRILEGDFNLPAGSLAMYCPTQAMNAKIAEVKIMVGDEIEKFCTYEEKHDRQLSGGHLDAQLHRFRRLWKVYFFIRRDVKKEHTHILVFLRDAIKKLALGHLSDDDDFHEVAVALATALTNRPDFPWYGYEIKDSVRAGAYRDEGTALGTYPLGCQSLRSFITLSDEGKNQADI